MAYTPATPLVGGVYDVADTNAERQAQGTTQAQSNKVAVFTTPAGFSGTRLNAMNNDFDATRRGSAAARKTDVVQLQGSVFDFKYFSDTV